MLRRQARFEPRPIAIANPWRPVKRAQASIARAGLAGEMIECLLTVFFFFLESNSQQPQHSEILFEFALHHLNPRLRRYQEIVPDLPLAIAPDCPKSNPRKCAPDQQQAR